jgi:hypothetical protein
MLFYTYDFRAGVSNTRPALCVCAGRDIIKIAHIIAETTVFVVLKHFYSPIVARDDSFHINAARNLIFLCQFVCNVYN